MSTEDCVLLISIIDAYKNYIDGSILLSEQARSDLLMIARNLDGEANFKGLYAIKSV